MFTGKITAASYGSSYVSAEQKNSARKLTEKNGMKTRKVGRLTFYDDIVQGTQEWLELRAGKVTCSNALTLMNKGKNQCLEANDIAMRNLKVNGNWYAERGHVIEHEFKEAFNKSLEQSGLKLIECGFIVNEDYPDAGYSPDGLIVRTDNHDEIVGLAEFKAYNDIVVRKDGGGCEPTGDPNEELVLTAKHRNACLDEMMIPPACIAQCNMAMMIMEMDEIKLFLCNPDANKTDQFIKKLLDSNTNEAKEMLEKAIPSGDYITPTPLTKVWTIKRNQTICNRLIKKLSQS